MKKISTILSAALILTSCTGYLNVRPQGEVLPTTDEEFASVIHRILREIEGGGDEYVIGNMETIQDLEGCADDLDANIKAGSIPLYAGVQINSMSLQYSYFWQTVRDCNIVIENLQGRSSATARSTLSAAYSIKAICYLRMLRAYCEPWEEDKAHLTLGLPIVDCFDISDRPLRSNLAQTYEYCRSLFDKALELNPQDDTYIFTEYIVKAYKARLLFWCAKWNDCIALCQDILDHSGLVLTPREGWVEMINAPSKTLGEVLVRSHINNSSELDWYFNALKSYIGSRPVSASLIRLYGDNPQKDIRYLGSFSSKRLNAKQPECRMRLSEIVLMKAESHAHIGEGEAALGLINELRSKRIEGVQPYTMASLPAVREGDRIVEDATGKAITPLMQAILDERRKELYMEGDRWFELKRNGRPEWWVINNGLKYTTRKYLYTYPIYKGDVDLNPDMVQNPGY